MRRSLSVTMVFAALSLAVGSAGQQSHMVKAAGEEVQVIEVTARKYQFNPAEIRVKKGTKIRLKIRAIDRTHGFRISLYPERAERSGAPGLRFASQHESWKLEKDREQVIEFIAERPGTYPFKCSVSCGLGHRRMKGQLLVEE